MWKIVVNAASKHKIVRVNELTPPLWAGGWISSTHTSFYAHMRMMHRGMRVCGEKAGVWTLHTRSVDDAYHLISQKTAVPV